MKGGKKGKDKHFGVKMSKDEKCKKSLAQKQCKEMGLIHNGSCSVH